MSDSDLSFGEVLGLLQDEFPDVTISKIRFLESQGLIDPERTPSGWRPAVVITCSKANSDPVFGPRVTMRTPPGPTSLRSTSTSSPGAIWSSAKVIVWGSVAGRSRGCPHDEQKLDSAGFLCPQLLQKTSATGLTPRPTSVPETPARSRTDARPSW